jgi:hypothetical protein
LLILQLFGVKVNQNLFVAESEDNEKMDGVKYKENDKEE